MAWRARKAAEELAGVGDPDAGEWAHHTPGGYTHLRRRLNPVEALAVGPVVDVRGTPEAAERLRDVLGAVSPAIRADQRFVAAALDEARPRI